MRFPWTWRHWFLPTAEGVSSDAECIEIQREWTELWQNRMSIILNLAANRQQNTPAWEAPGHARQSVSAFRCGVRDY